MKTKFKQDISSGPLVTIDEQVYRKVMYWINKSSLEISGLGKVVLEKESNTIRVIDAILLVQKNTGSSTELDATAIAKAMFSLKDTPGDLRWWWHSHVNMNVFWSNTDLSALNQLGSGGWFCASVFNKKNEMRSAFCQSFPVNILLDQLDTNVNSTVDPDTLKHWDDEYDKNIEEVKCEVKPWLIDDNFDYNALDFMQDKQESKILSNNKSFKQQDLEFSINENLRINEETGAISSNNKRTSLKHDQWWKKYTKDFSKI